MLRLPEGMRDRIADAAKANSRSMNAEIVARLETSFDKDSALTTDAIALLLEQQEERLKHWFANQVLEALIKK